MGWIIGVLAVPLLIILVYALRQSRISSALLCEIQSLEEYIAAGRKSLSRRAGVKASAIRGGNADSSVRPQPAPVAAKQLLQPPEGVRAPVPEPVGPAQARTASRG